MVSTLTVWECHLHHMIESTDLTITWICATCDTPNYSTSLSDTYISETSNQFDALTNLDAITAATLDSPTNQSSLNSRSSVASSSDIGSPLQRSSPIKRPSRRKNASRPLKILTSNLQSLNAKKEVFWESVDSCQPDLIIANETWLKPDQLNSEMMPPGFNTPIRRDRADGYGGVMIATKQDLIDGEIKLETECEIVATKVELYQQQPLIIMSAYRPTNNDLTYTQNLCQIIRNIVAKFPSATIWLSGDLNLPDISWSNDSIIGHQYKRSINECFLSTFHDLGLTQIVDFCTRQDRTLDLFLTNRPSLISKCSPLPGVSDHEMVLTVSDVRTKRQKPVPRKILLWSRADMAAIKSQLSDFATAFTSNNTVNTPVDTLLKPICKVFLLTVCHPK